MDSYAQFMEIFELLTPEQRARLIFLASLMAQSNDATPDSDADSPDNADTDA